MKNLYTGLLALGILAGSTACAQANNTQLETALAARGEISDFYQALINTGILNELNENTNYTVFAPTNAAFAEIQPRVYPCFYSAACRQQVAAILRNHIVPEQQPIERFVREAGRTPTLGAKHLYVEEAYKGDYTVEGQHIRDPKNELGIYAIDGVITTPQELSVFRMPIADATTTVIRRTTTTYTPPAVPLSAGGNVHYHQTSDDIPDTETETTTTTIYAPQ